MRNHGVLCLVAAAMAFGRSAMAFDIPTGVDGLTVQLDSTLKYSSVVRLPNLNAELIQGVNSDDGDHNFRPGGFASNRADLLSELDINYKDVGARFSAAGWYDFAYHGRNYNQSPLTNNNVSVDYNKFTKATTELDGQYAEILDAFVFAKTRVDDHLLTVRLGRHTLLWGESLFVTGNGIAGTQAPTDVIKALQVPNSQAKELFLPVTQFSAQFGLTPNISIEAFTQFEYRKNRTPGVGSYFSPADILDVGGETLLLPGGAGFYHGKDSKPNGPGPFGLALRYRLEDLDTDFGLYFVRYDAKSPEVYLRPGVGVNPFLRRPKLGEYLAVYPEDIKTVGFSASSTIFDINVAGEVSYRWNLPLQSNAATLLPFQTPSRGDPLYAVGESLNWQVSAVKVLQASRFWDSVQLAGELAWNQRTGISRNPGQLATGATAGAMTTFGSVEFDYFQVLPNLDLAVPVSISWSPYGNSSTVSNFGFTHGGTVSAGLSGTYRQNWKFGVNYATYFGRPTNNPFVDRDFVSFTVSRSF